MQSGIKKTRLLKNQSKRGGHTTIISQPTLIIFQDKKTNNKTRTQKSLINKKNNKNDHIKMLKITL